MLITLAGMSVAFLMVVSSAEQRAQTPAHRHRRAQRRRRTTAGRAWPVTGWSTTGGDLRVPHFVGVHGLQVVPLFALVLAMLMAGSPRLRDELVRVRLVWTFAAGYAGLIC